MYRYISWTINAAWWEMQCWYENTTLKNPVRRFPIYLFFYVMNPPHPFTFPGKVKYRGKKALTYQEIESFVQHLYVHP